jgi:tetratricopeptide (TPR) repeat protein
MPRRELVFILLVLLLFSICLSGTKGGIKGIVFDSQKKSVEGAVLTIISVEYPSTQYALKTNKRGEFIQVGLEPGNYQVRCEKEGYMPDGKQIKVSISEIAETFFTLNTAAPKLEVKEPPGKTVSQKAYELYEEGKYEEAAKEYQAAIEKNPGEATNYFNLGVTLMALNKPDEAVEVFKKTIEIQPENFGALKSLGQIYTKENEFEEAAKYLDLASKLSAEDPEVFYNLGVSRMNIGDYPRAAEAFHKTFACNERYVDALYMLGLVYLHQNKMEEARAFLEKFLKLNPDDPKAEDIKKMIEIIKKK